MQQDYTLRLSLVANEHATEHLKAWNAVFAEGRKRGNSAYYGPALVEMEIADMEKRAAWVYRTCCEIWEIQGRPKERSFFRAIFESCLQPLFSVREGCFKHDLELHAKRTGKTIGHNDPILGGHFKREVGKLRARWNTILEIATRDAENEERLKREQDHKAQTSHESRGRVSPDQVSERQQRYTFLVDPSGIDGSGASFSWRELEIRFQDIQAKCVARESLYSLLTWTEWQTGAIGEKWSLGGSPDLQTEFESLGSIAAQKLGYAPNDSAYKNWLGRVQAWMRETKLDRDKSFVWNTTGSFQQDGVSGTTKSLRSERIAELSAKFCMALMARGTPEVSVPQQPGQHETAGHDTKPRPAVREVRKTKPQSRRKEVIFGAIQSGLTGQKYCAALDSRRLRLPDRWIEEGCPRTYVQAYRDTQWRKRIQDEKCRYRELYDRTSKHEREIIIQGDMATRLTRQ
jgi:hypothetical protein